MSQEKPKDPPFILERDDETDDERRLREAINRECDKLMKIVDAAIALRSAPPSAQRMRHRARGSLQDFALQSQHAYGTSKRCR